jgi:hypothetical protein
MKPPSFAILTVIIGSVALPAGAQLTLDWFQISAGAATSTGGVYTVTGTVGQSDAGTMTGGQFGLVGGFWAIIAVPTPGAPTLAITRTSTNTVVVFWPSPSAGFELEQNSDLVTTDWAAVPQTPTDDGTTKCVTVGPPQRSLFFRLRRSLGP